MLLLLQATRETAAAEKAEGHARAENAHDEAARALQQQHGASPAVGTGVTTGVTQPSTPMVETPLGPTGPMGGRASEPGDEGVTPGHLGDKLVTGSHPGAIAAAPVGPAEIESSGGLGEEATGPMAPREEGEDRGINIPIKIETAGNMGHGE